VTWQLCLAGSQWVGNRRGIRTRAGGNLPPSRVGLFLPGHIVTSLLHFHPAALTVVVAVVGGGGGRHR